MFLCTLESATCPLRGSDVTTPSPFREGLSSPLGSPGTAHRPTQRHLLRRGPARRQRQQPSGSPPAPGHPLPPAHPRHHRRDDGQQRPRHQAFRRSAVGRGARRQGRRCQRETETRQPNHSHFHFTRTFLAARLLHLVLALLFPANFRFHYANEKLWAMGRIKPEPVVLSSLLWARNKRRQLAIWAEMNAILAN